MAPTALRREGSPSYCLVLSLCSSCLLLCFVSWPELILGQYGLRYGLRYEHFQIPERRSRRSFFSRLVQFFVLVASSAPQAGSAFLTVAKTMAEILSADANKGEDMTVVTETIEEFIIGKDKVDLPQDYLFSPTATAAAAAVVDLFHSPRHTFSKRDSEETVVATNKRAWVSPNKNDDVPSTTESFPSSDEMKFEAKDSNVSDVIKKLLDGFVKRKEEACIKTIADEENSDPDFDAEYATGFEVANEESEVNLTVIGKRLEIENFADVAAEAVLHASSKSFANIIHEEKRVMLVLPSRVSSGRWISLAPIMVFLTQN
jgi:hypothetical protein